MSGQVCFDFMLNEADNVLYCIECESCKECSAVICQISDVSGASEV
jgi:hypothetical protein